MIPLLFCCHIICCFSFKIFFGLLFCGCLPCYSVIIGCFCIGQSLFCFIQCFFGIGYIAFQLVAGQTIIFSCVPNRSFCRFHLQFCTFYAVFRLSHIVFSLCYALFCRNGAGIQTIFIVFFCVFIRFAADFNLMCSLIVACCYCCLLLCNIKLQIICLEFCKHVPFLNNITDLYVNRFHRIGQCRVDLSSCLGFHRSGQANGIF